MKGYGFYGIRSRQKGTILLLLQDLPLTTEPAGCLLPVHDVLLLTQRCSWVTQGACDTGSNCIHQAERGWSLSAGDSENDGEIFSNIY